VPTETIVVEDFDLDLVVEESSVEQDLLVNKTATGTCLACTPTYYDC
jgi:hypothetical protein